MEPRLIVACLLIALAALAFVGLALWLRHNGHDGTVARDRKRQLETHRQRLAERDSDEG